jgi:hypothetical protein
MSDQRIEARINLESIKIRTALMAVGQNDLADYIGDLLKKKMPDTIEAVEVFMDMGYNTHDAILINFGIELGGMAATQGVKVT